MGGVGRAARHALVLVLLAAAAGAVRGEGKDWTTEPAYKTLVQAEVRTLTGLLRAALKADHRRQAWYCADRILAVEPANAEAAAVLEKWRDDELLLGMAPEEGYVRKRDVLLEELGDDYFHFGETLNGAGLDPETYYPINVRALSYGSQAGPLVAALDAERHAWFGTWLDWPREPVQKLLGPYFASVSFPPEFDDDYLKVRVRWAEAKVAVLGSWRFFSDQKHDEALRLLGMLARAEDFFTDTFGGGGKAGGPKTDVLLFTEAAVYDKAGAKMVPEQAREDFLASSSWYDRGSDRIFALWRHRENGWIGEDAVLLGQAARRMARRHLGADTGGVQGRGAWLLDGLAGAFEGFRLPEGSERKGTIDPSRCWRLAVAKALRDEKALLPWEEFLELDAAKAKALPRKTVKVTFRGGTFEAKDADVAAAQATAVAVGILKADKGKGARKLAALLADLMKRDSLGHPEKDLGWKAGRLVEEASRAIDAATGR
jgi:hypothetical protein